MYDHPSHSVLRSGLAIESVWLRLPMQCSDRAAAHGAAAIEYAVTFDRDAVRYRLLLIRACPEDGRHLGKARAFNKVSPVPGI